MTHKRFLTWTISRVFLAISMLVACLGAFAQEDYRVGPEDELSITVWGHPDLSMKVRVGLEGKISFPMLGEVYVSNMTVGQIERKLRQLLADGYLVDPQVTIQVTEYKSKKFFVMGEVNNPGTYPLTRRMTVIEALALAGGVKAEADPEIMIVRPKKERGNPSSAILPNEADPSELIRIRIREVLEGKISENTEIRDGDTIFVPKVRVFYVTGEVKNPGQFMYRKDMTVLNAISAAGGFTEKAARKKVKIVREKNGRKVEISVALDDFIEPNDTVVVPESFW